MRLFIISLLVSLTVSWLAVDKLLVKPESNDSEPDPIPERISLLGNSVSFDGLTKKITFDRFTNLQEMFVHIHTASPVELKQWYTTLIASARPTDKAIRLIVARLAAIDPADAFEFIKANDESGWYCPIVLDAWARVDFSAAFDAYLSIKDRSVNLDHFLGGLGEDQLENAFRIMVEQGFDEEYPDQFASAFTVLARNDPHEAAERALQIALLRKGNNYTDHLKHVMNTWSRMDPEAASRWIAEIDDPESKGLAARMLITSSPDVQNLETVWEFLNENERSAAIGYFRNATIPDMNQLLDWVDTNVESPTEHKLWIEQLMSSLLGSGRSEKMPEILSRLEGKFEDSELRHSVGSISREWASRDFDAFQKWAQSLDDPAIRKVTDEVESIHRKRMEFLDVLEEWKELGDEFIDWDKFGDQRSTVVIDQVFKSSPGAEPQAILNQLPESWRDVALKTFASRHAEEAPEETLRFLESQPEGPFRNQELQRSLSYWAANDPSQAAEWVSDLEESEQKELAAWNLGNIWTRADPAAAFAWVKNQSPSTSRDQAAEQAIRVGGQYHPAKALSLASSLSDPQVRDELTMQTVHHLALRDPGSAAAQIRSLNLPPELASQAAQRIEQERALQASFEK